MPLSNTDRTKAWRLANLERYRLLQRNYARRKAELKRIAEGRDGGMIYNKPN